MDLHIFSASDYNQSVLEVVFPSILMCVSLSLERLEGFYSNLVFKNLSVIGWCTVNMETVSLKTSAPKHKNAIFSKIALSILIKFE
jgi:hypothetical protein